MALVSGGRSTLNPNAPLFIPAAFRQVEDFSPEWWQLVTTSTWYRDYWLSQHQGEDGFYDNNSNNFTDDNNDDDYDHEYARDVADLLPDVFDFDAAQEFEEFIQSYETQVPSNGLVVKDVVDGQMKNLSLSKMKEERSPKSLAEPAKYVEKQTRAVNPRCSPRRIQQPR